MVAGHDEIRPAFRLLVVLGIVGLVILGIGLAQFIQYEPPSRGSGIKARIVGVFDYDLQTGVVAGGNKDHFRTNEPFAAAVDWSSLPPDLVVGAGWFAGGFAIDVGGIGPAPAASLVSHPVVPVNTGGRSLPAGQFLFAVERFSGGRAVEVLARRTVIVLGSQG